MLLGGIAVEKKPLSGVVASGLFKKRDAGFLPESPLSVKLPRVPPFVYQGNT